MKKILPSTIIIIGIALVAIFVYPWDEEVKLSIAIMTIGLILCAIWLSFYLGFGVKINKVAAELCFVVAIPIALFIVRTLLRITEPLWHKRPERQKREPWFTGSIFDVLKLRLKPLEVVLGIKWKKAIRIDLAKDHTFIGGSTGAGKTVMLNGIIAQLLLKDNPPNIWIFDLKGAREDAMRLWEPCIERYITTLEDAAKALMDLAGLMDTRNRDGYEQEMVIVIDEVVHLTKHMTKPYRRVSLENLALLARSARSAGIKLVGATQYPSYMDVPKPISHNFMRKVCLAVTGQTQGKVILELSDKIPLDLPVRDGDFILREGRRFRDGRSILITEDDIREIVTRAMTNAGEEDIRLRILQRITIGVKVGDRIQGLNAIAESLSLDSDFLKVIYRNFAVAGAFKMGGKSAQAGYRLAVEPAAAMGLVTKYIAAGEWDNKMKSLWGNNNEH